MSPGPACCRTSGAVPAGEVPSLDHEVLDDAVELAALEAEPFLHRTGQSPARRAAGPRGGPARPGPHLPGGQSHEVLHRFGHRFAEEPDDDAARILLAHAEVEEHLGGGRAEAVSRGPPALTGPVSPGPRSPRPRLGPARPPAAPTDLGRDLGALLALVGPRGGGQQQ